MTSAIRINHFEQKILISKSFQKAAMNPTSKEYAELMEVMANHPNYKLDQRAIKTNPKKDTYKGLTYDYMREYICRHSNSVKRTAEFEEILLRAKCHMVSYPNVKAWFLAAYPEIDDFTPEQYVDECEAKNDNSSNFEVIMQAA